MRGKYAEIIDGITTFVTVNPNKKLVTAVVIDSVGNIVKGHALCDPADKFDPEFGMDLAVARAEARYNARQEKRLLQESDKRG
jgi:hypothetical protein